MIVDLAGAPPFWLSCSWGRLVGVVEHLREAKVKDIETALRRMHEHGIDQVLVNADTATLGTANAVSPGLNEPHFISPFSVKTDAGQLGIAGWTSTNPNVPPGHSLSGDGAESLGFRVAAEWGARPRSERTLIR
jgi:hypothetical protein